METIGELTKHDRDPVRRNRWVLMIDGVDAYTVNDVKLPVLVVGSNVQELSLSLYNPGNGKQNARLKAWFDVPTFRFGELKLLGPTGNVVEHWKFQVKLKTITFDDLDYTCSGLMATHVLFELRSLVLD